jgi:hypothetical protein
MKGKGKKAMMNADERGYSQANLPMGNMQRGMAGMQRMQGMRIRARRSKDGMKGKGEKAMMNADERG